MLLRTTSTGQRTSAQRRGGFVIVAVLMVVTVLSLAAYQYSALMDAEVMAAERIRKATESKALADSGIHKAMGLLADPDAFEGVLNSNPYDNPGSFQSQLVTEGASARSQGRFSVVTLDLGEDASSGSIPLRYGVSDETGKLNINALLTLDSSGRILHDALMKLDQMTDDIAWSIVDWIDPDEEPNPGGAETEIYGARQPPYQSKNAPLDSIEELLFVKGVTPSLLFGTDRNRNGQLDPGEDDGGGFNPGWAAYLTVYSREKNVDAEGNPRINLNGNDLAQLQTDLTAAVGSELTTFILGYRLFGTGSTGGGGGGKGGGNSNGGGGGGGGGGGKGSNVQISVIVLASIGQLETLVQEAIKNGTQPRQRVSSVFALINATISIEQQQENQGGGKGGNQSTTITMQFRSPLADQSQQVDLLPKLLDKTTTQQGTELPARININTAPREVLLTLPGMTDADVDGIIAKRPAYQGGSSPDTKYATVAWLLTDGALTVAQIQAMERYITARSQVFRVQSIGYFDEGGPMARVEAVIDTNQGKPRIVYYRDLTDLGRSIDPRNLNR